MPTFSSERSQAIRNELKAEVRAAPRFPTVRLASAVGVAAALCAISLFVFESSPHPLISREQALHQLEGGSSSADTSYSALPTLREFVGGGAIPDDAEPAVEVAGVVVGTVTKAHLGSGWTWAEEGGSSRLAFDDPTAQARTVFLDIEVAESTGTVAAHTVKVGIYVPGGRTALPTIDSLRSLGTIVLPLLPQGRLAEHPDAYRVFFEGDGIGLVSASGDFAFPGIRGGYQTEADGQRAEAAFMDSVTSVSALRDAEQ